MPRVSQETLEKLNAFIDSLPDEAKSKCGTCTETLTHLTMQAEVISGAGTATVTRALAEKINENAAPLDRVSGIGLRDRVRRHEGIVADHYNKPAHVSYNSGENEWYTPAEIMEAVHAVMGKIDLDPASSDIANQTVNALTYFTKNENGLNKTWFGKVFLNPPYAQPLIKQFSDKLCESIDNNHITEVIVLVNNATETNWFQNMARRVSAICFTDKRIKFLDPCGNPGAPLQGQAILYWGHDIEQFRLTFHPFGFVMRHV
jgi:phage N-6-adenine-methyltransferase